MKYLPSLRVVLWSLVLAAGIAGGVLWYAYRHPQGPQSSPSAPSTATASVRCMDSPEYFVIDRNPGAPGLDVVAVRKTDAGMTFPCTASSTAALLSPSSSSSFVQLQNDLPEFVLGIAGSRFLIVDSGTAPPPRGLLVYDLSSHSEHPAFTDTYDRPISLATDTVTYWEATTQAVTKANCPDAGTWTSQGLGSVMVSHVELALPALTVKALGEYRCEPTQ